MSTHPASRSLWRTLRDAIRGSTDIDFTALPIGRAVALLAIPMVLEMSMESVFVIVDIFWVSSLGSNAVAAVGLTEAMIALVYTVAMGLSAGATALVARRTGEKDPEGASRAAVHAIAVGILASAVIGVAGALLAPHLLVAMGAKPEVVKVGAGYTAVMLGGNASIVLLFLLNAIFRGAGDASAAMRSLWLANILNILLGPCFIFGLGPFPEMGVTGAAVATTIGRGSGVLFQLLLLFRPGGRISLRRAHLSYDAAEMRTLLRISGPGAVQTLIETASWLGLVRILSRYGSDALAGYTIAMRIAVFALLPSVGIANAAATLVGQNLGAGQPDRAARSVQVAAWANVAFLGLVGIALVSVPRFIVGLFPVEAGALPYGADCLRIVALGFLFYGYGFVMVQAFNGAGDTITPSLLHLLCFWLFKIPLAWVLAVGFGFGPRGAFAAIAAAYSLLAVVAGILFRRGRWKTRRV